MLSELQGKYGSCFGPPADSAGMPLGVVREPISVAV
jgi:hypothetical protein